MCRHIFNMLYILALFKFFFFLCICVHVVYVADLSQFDHLHLW